MVYGIGTVFVFLCTLIVAMAAMSLVLNRFFPQEETIEPAVSGNNSIADNAQILPILQAAIDQHRQQK
jgi:sodium pump decarboxylases, gamma subunit